MKHTLLVFFMPFHLFVFSSVRCLHYLFWWYICCYFLGEVQYWCNWRDGSPWRGIEASCGVYGWNTGEGLIDGDSCHTLHTGNYLVVLIACIHYYCSLLVQEWLSLVHLFLCSIIKCLMIVLGGWVAFCSAWSGTKMANRLHVHSSWCYCSKAQDSFSQWH